MDKMQATCGQGCCTGRLKAFVHKSSTAFPQAARHVRTARLLEDSPLFECGFRKRSSLDDLVENMQFVIELVVRLPSFGDLAY